MYRYKVQDRAYGLSEWYNILAMKLIKTKSFEGYSLEDIYESVKPSVWQEFKDWFEGSPADVYENKPVVYKWDWDNFLKATSN